MRPGAFGLRLRAAMALVPNALGQPPRARNAPPAGRRRGAGERGFEGIDRYVCAPWNGGRDNSAFRPLRRAPSSHRASESRRPAAETSSGVERWSGIAAVERTRGIGDHRSCAVWSLIGPRRDPAAVAPEAAGGRLIWPICGSASRVKAVLPVQLGSPGALQLRKRSVANRGVPAQSLGRLEKRFGRRTPWCRRAHPAVAEDALGIRDAAPFDQRSPLGQRLGGYDGWLSAMRRRSRGHRPVYLLRRLHVPAMTVPRLVSTRQPAPLGIFG